MARDLTEHAQLVVRADRWLRNTLHCRVVLTELRAATAVGDIPDDVGWVGWVGGCCIQVECKVSRSDFISDLKKISRRIGMPCLGDWRFYLTPPGLLTGLELPEGWGWYEVDGTRVRHAGGEEYSNMDIPPCHSCRDSEVDLLVSALARERNGHA